ncbi:hypothetical protein ACOMHN_005862 [Nucella lapillus]
MLPPQQLLLPQMHVLMLLMLMLMMPDVINGRTTCIALSTRQDTTNVTCLFGKDISQNDFNVQFFQTLQSEAKMVLACNRLPAGGLICDKQKDVDFDEEATIASHLTLSVRPPPTRDNDNKQTQGGQYLCQTVPGVEGEKAQRCSVTYTTTSVVAPQDIRDTALPPKPANTENVFRREKDGSDPLITCFFVLFILLIVAGIIVCVFCYKKRAR